jgi:deferrochelatase/peroxidase EfeB
MKHPRNCPFASRRGFFGLLSALGPALLAARGEARASSEAEEKPSPPGFAGREPFYGAVQGGILTPPQGFTSFAVFDVTASTRDGLIALLRRWTLAAARLTEGAPLGPLEGEGISPESGEAWGLPPARLTLTFGFGPELFEKDGIDRFGLKARRPPALAPLPRFPGDQFLDGHEGGDLSVQACAEDPQVAFHAVRALARLAKGEARLRWIQAGFLPHTPPGETPRNLMGFKDGTNNPRTPEDLAAHVWVGEEGPGWLAGGSFLVVRRIRIALEHWDQTPLTIQEQVIGRRKLSGAPLNGTREEDPVDLTLRDPNGDLVIPEEAHIRLASPAAVGGAKMLRRSYAYHDGANVIAERWPPWRQGLEYDAGLLFLAYQRDPRRAFIPLFAKMARIDALSQFTTHTASASSPFRRGQARRASSGLAFSPEGDRFENKGGREVRAPLPPQESSRLRPRKASKSGLSPTGPASGAVSVPPLIRNPRIAKRRAARTFCSTMRTASRCAASP